MRAVWTVFRKEVVENLRDRRVILSAFFFGVLLAPVIFGLTTTMVSKRAVANQDKPLKLPVAGGQYAPNRPGMFTNPNVVWTSGSLSVFQKSARSPSFQPRYAAYLRNSSTVVPSSQPPRSSGGRSAFGSPASAARVAIGS